MQVPAQTRAQRAWDHFVESNYLTWFTDWMMKFGGKGAHSVLILTTLYMSAELYPGVNLPPALSLTVFLLQMFMLDVGGLGLATLARQARESGNTDGARLAKRLSWFLIGIMIAGIVTVCVEQAIAGFKLTPDAQNWINAFKIGIEVSLVVARSFCAVLYGVAIHSLNDHATGHQRVLAQTPDYTVLMDEKIAQLRADFGTQMQQTLHGFRADIIKQMPVIEPLNYDALAKQMMSLLLPSFDQFQASFQEEVLASIPQPVDIAQLALEVAPLVQAMSVSMIAEDRLPNSLDEERPEECNEERSKERKDTGPLAPARSAKRVSSGATDVLVKVRRLVKRNPQITAPEIAQKVGCSFSWAGKLKARVLAEQ